MKNEFKVSMNIFENNLKIFPNSQLMYPNDNLIRLFAGDKYVNLPKPPAKLMDHGFGHGNNLAYFTSLGYDCSGCEISDNYIDVVNKLYEDNDKTIDLRKITGLELPYGDNEFDIVVSWSAIYFNGNRDDTQFVVNELHRILKPGGSLLLSSVHSDTTLYEHCKKIGPESYIVDTDKYSNLKGTYYFFPDSEDSFVKLFRNFSNVTPGYYSFNLCNPEMKTAYHLMHAVK